jgi:hypothetical protein
VELEVARQKSAEQKLAHGKALLELERKLTKEHVIEMSALLKEFKAQPVAVPKDK